MKYQVGKTGRVVVARFEDREDILGSLTSIVKKEDIRAGVFYLILLHFLCLRQLLLR